MSDQETPETQDRGPEVDSAFQASGEPADSQSAGPSEADAPASDESQRDVAPPDAETLEKATPQATKTEEPPAKQKVEAAPSRPPESESASESVEQEAPEKEVAPERPEKEEVRRVRQAQEQNLPVEGRVIGWNNGGFHVLVGGLTAFCPRSEIEIKSPRAPKTYLDRDFRFRVLRIEDGGRRVILSRASQLKSERTRKKEKLLSKLESGSVVEGKVVSLTDFGAFVDLGGVQGLVHVSEISHQRVERPEKVLEVGQKVKVEILKVEKGGRRVSLSMKSLEPDPWKEAAARYPSGSMVKGTVERTTNFGAFIELEPGITGLLPTSGMSLPRGTKPERAFPPGKVISVQVVSVDTRRHRISLGMEGARAEGSRADYQAYRKQQRHVSEKATFNPLAEAFKKLERTAD